MIVKIPIDQYPVSRTIGPKVHSVFWYGVAIATFSSSSQASSFVKYTKFWVRRLGKAFLVDGTDLPTQLSVFLANAANPALGFSPVWNEI